MYKNGLDVTAWGTEEEVTEFLNFMHDKFNEYCKLTQGKKYPIIKWQCKGPVVAGDKTQVYVVDTPDKEWWTIQVKLPEEKHPPCWDLKLRAIYIWGMLGMPRTRING